MKQELVSATEQAAVVDGVSRFVDTLATSITQTMAAAADKVAMESAIVRQRYRFEAQLGVLRLIQQQRDELLAARERSDEPTEHALINQQLQLLSEQLQGTLVQAGVPSNAATTAAATAVIAAPPPAPAVAKIAHRRGK